MPAGRLQRGVIRQPQVLPKPDDGRRGLVAALVCGFHFLAAFVRSGAIAHAGIPPQNEGPSGIHGLGGGFGCVISAGNSTGTVWFKVVALTWNV